MIQIDMEMPKGCRTCPLMMHCEACEGYDSYCILDINGEHPYWDYDYEGRAKDKLAPDYRPEWCPIKG